MVDISGCPLNVGDKVAVQYEQLFRIGQITGFTPKKVVVAFDFAFVGSSLQEAKLSPWKMAKVVRQEVGLKEYYDYMKQ